MGFPLTPEQKRRYTDWERAKNEGPFTRRYENPSGDIGTTVTTEATTRLITRGRRKGQEVPVLRRTTTFGPGDTETTDVDVWTGYESPVPKQRQKDK